MAKLSEGVIQFFQNQDFTIVSTLDADGGVHNSCKGIVRVSENGEIYLLDLYEGKTYENLKRNADISITAVDEHRFKGYCLKGKGRIIAGDQLDPQLITAWGARIASRLTQRLLKNIHEEKGHPRHPEALLPQPKYMIVMKVGEIVDLTPQHLK